MVGNEGVKKGLVAILVVAILVLSYLLLKDIAIAIIFGLLFAYIFNPVYKKINTLIRHKNISAFILVVGLIFLVTIPIILLVPSLAKQTYETYSLLQNYDFAKIFSKYAGGDFADSITLHLKNVIGKIFSSLLDQLSTFLVNLPSLFLQLAVFLFTFFFTVRDSDKLNKYLTTLSPFSESTERKFLKEFRGITNAIIYGQVFIGIVQGLAVGVGLYFLGIENILILTFIACIFSIIPILGSWVVWLPVGVLQLMTGNSLGGIIFLLYGGLFVSSIDNFIRPILLSRQSNLPVVLSVIGTIGGLYFVGIAGLILGPLILAYLLIIIEFYREGKLDEIFRK
ncbi:MAG: AI-2E family transporter [archaeon]